MLTFGAMHFISEIRYNPGTGCEQKYYRIKETFRDRVGKVRSRILLNVGFLSGLRPEDIRDIGKGLTWMSEHRDQQTIFGDAFAHYPAAEDGSQPASHFPSERRAFGCPPVLRVVGILDSEHHTLPTQRIGNQPLLDGDHKDNVHAETGYHGGYQCIGGKGASPDLL